MGTTQQTRLERFHRPARLMALATLTVAAGFMVARPAQGQTRKPAIGSIAFVSAREGWVTLGGDGRTVSIVHTFDAGRTWTRLASLPYAGLELHFADSQRGWAIAAPPAPCAGAGYPERCRDTIIATSDGGRHWHTVMRPGKSVQITELDYGAGKKDFVAQETPDCGFNCSGRIFQTSDGGLHWTQMPSFPSHTMSVSFAGTQTEWAGVQVHCGTNWRKSISAVDVTHDGGAKWHRQFVIHGRCAPSVSFVDARSGWFLLGPTQPFCSSGGCFGYLLYHTEDGGAHWRLRQGKPGLDVAPSWWVKEGFAGPVRFVRPQTGWIPFSGGAGPGYGGVLVTRDGGVHWTRVLAVYQPAQPDNIALVDARNGWFAGCYMHSECDRLFRTGDGGMTWRRVQLP